MNLDEVRVKINDINDQMLASSKSAWNSPRTLRQQKKRNEQGYLRCQTGTDILDKVTRDAGPDLDLYARRFFEALFSLSRTVSVRTIIPR